MTYNKYSRFRRRNEMRCADSKHVLPKKIDPSSSRSFTGNLGLILDGNDVVSLLFVAFAYWQPFPFSEVILDSLAFGSFGCLVVWTMKKPAGRALRFAYRLLRRRK